MSATARVSQIGQFLLEADAAVLEHGRRLGVGLGEDAGTLAGDVALGGTDLRRLGGRSGLVLGGAVELLLDACRCGRPCSS